MWALIVLMVLGDGSIVIERRGVYGTRIECEEARPHADSACVDMRKA